MFDLYEILIMKYLMYNKDFIIVYHIPSSRSANEQYKNIKKYYKKIKNKNNKNKNKNFKKIILKKYFL